MTATRARECTIDLMKKSKLNNVAAMTNVFVLAFFYFFAFFHCFCFASNKIEYLCAIFYSILGAHFSFAHFQNITYGCHLVYLFNK